jgi:DNA-nicking Smr family endonuclease
MNDDDSDFADLIPGVKRLRNDRINVYKHREKPVPRVNKIEHEPSVQSHSPDTTIADDSHFNAGIQKKLQRKIKQGLIRPGASLDLHGFRQEEALVALNQFIGDAQSHDERMVIIIHGQGYRSQNEAVLKPLVQRWLAGHSQVLAWCPAQIRDGAGGASYVYLRSS